jgi:hypothetical protein
VLEAADAEAHGVAPRRGCAAQVCDDERRRDSAGRLRWIGSAQGGPEGSATGSAGVWLELVVGK